MVPEYRKLVKALIKNTRSNEIEWQLTDDNRKYQTKICDKKISIHVLDGCLVENLADADSHPEAVLELSFDSGKEIDAIKIFSRNSSDFKKLNDLFETVRHQVLQIDKHIEDLLKALK